MSGSIIYAYVGNNPVNANDPSGMVEPKLIPIVSQVQMAYNWFAANKDREAQVSIGVNGTLGAGIPAGIPAGFIGGGVNLGVTSHGQIFVQGVATGSLGVGMFGGVGVQGGVSYSNSPTPSGISVSRSYQADFNFGAGTTVGGSLQIAPRGGVGIGSAPPGSLGRLGVGGGLQISGGVTQTVTIATPPLFGGAPTATVTPSSPPSLPLLWDFPSNPSFNDYLGDMPSGFPGAASGGFLLYPNKANTNMMRSVYSK